MDRCGICGKEIRFIKRKNNKALVVNINSVYFIPDTFGNAYYIHDGVMRRGSAASDGLKGYTLHNCEVR